MSIIGDGITTNARKNNEPLVFLYSNLPSDYITGTSNLNISVPIGFRPMLIKDSVDYALFNSTCHPAYFSLSMSSNSSYTYITCKRPGKYKINIYIRIYDASELRLYVTQQDPYSRICSIITQDYVDESYSVSLLKDDIIEISARKLQTGQYGQDIIIYITEDS